VFHVYARGNNKGLIYADDSDRKLYLRLLEGTVRRRQWRLLAYCLMNNHVHLLIETPQANLAVGMQRMHSLYASCFNKRHGRVGHVFQGRYGAIRVKPDEQLWTVAAYVVANPVRSGLCAEAADWPWSSCAAVLGDGGPDWIDRARLFEYVGAAGGDAAQRFAELVRNAGSPAGAGLPEEGTAVGASAAPSC